jgi:hypothetical protein
MIKANELRVGNLLLVHGTALAALEILEDGVCYFFQPGTHVRTVIEFEDAEPIPLTSEWLQRLGFEDDNHITVYDVSRRQPFLFSICSTDKGFELFGGEGPIGKAFNYLHQLQNLYFALTGEELTFSPAT